MKMELSGHMRLEQRMKLAPRMIQSMEVLQLPLLALQEKIEAELNSNPVLELEQEEERPENEESQDEYDANDNELIVEDGSNNASDFERLHDMDDDFQEAITQAPPARSSSYSDETDPKYDAIQNTVAPEISLHDYLNEQWVLLDISPAVLKAGQTIIDYIDKKGYLTVRIEQLYNKDKSDFTFDDLKEALCLIHTLDPAGVGASDVRECLLIQIDQFPANMSLERRIISDCYDLLLENKLPDIARKLNCSLDDLNSAISRLSRLDTSPGLQVGRSNNRPVNADVIVEPRTDGQGYSIRLASTNIPSLKVSDFYQKMAKDRNVGEKTRQFLKQNIRSAQWLMDAIEQRNNTLLRVVSSIVDHQQEFFEKGQLYLKPLPMQKVADDIGVHIATVSRAVASKYVQCPQGILSLRSFFSSGTEKKDGTEQSWDAVKSLVQKIIDQEDKSNPLSDDQICDKLKEMEVGKIARRTVAKYRSLLNIPSARLRKRF